MILRDEGAVTVRSNPLPLMQYHVVHVLRRVTMRRDSCCCQTVLMFTYGKTPWDVRGKKEQLFCGSNMKKMPISHFR